MIKDNNRAFSCHRKNGVYLKFPNGNAISTIWGVATYSQNHDGDFSNFEKQLDSMDCEIMPITEDKDLLEQIFQHFNRSSKDDSVIGWVSITDWLWVLNQLAKDSNKEG
jgi:hypothetical protein